jgi:hypothetical protein
MSDEELIRRALGGGEPPEAASPMLVDRAIAAGNIRRRNRMWTAGAIAIAVLVVGGVAVASVVDQENGAVVGVDPAIQPDSSQPAPPSTARIDEASTTAPSSDPATSVEPVASSVESLPTATAVTPTAAAGTTTTLGATTTTTTTLESSTTTTVGVTTTQPAYVPPPPPPPCPESMIPNNDLVELAADGAPPADEAFFVSRADVFGNTRRMTELWTSERHWGGVSVLIPDNYGHCFDQAEVVDYDGRWLWIAITTGSRCPCSTYLSVMVRGDMTTGEVRTVWSGLGTPTVIDVLPDGEGGALLLAGPGPGAPFIALYDVAATDDGSNEAPIDAWNVNEAEIRIGEIAPDGTRVAYSWSDPATSAARLYIEGVGPPGLAVAPQPIDLSSEMFFIADIDWSADGTRLLVQHSWEGSAAFTIDPGAVDPASTVEYISSTACWLPDGSIVSASWAYTVDEPAIPADIVRDVVGDSSVIAPSVVGGELVCLPSGHVVWTQYDGGVGPPSFRIADLSGAQDTIDLGPTISGWPHISRW